MSVFRCERTPEMKLLLVQTGFIGDLILSTPIIEGLLEAFPGASLSVLTTPQGADLVSGDERLRSVITFDKRHGESGVSGLFRAAAKLRREAFDVAISLHKSYRTALLLRLARIPVLFGFREAALAWLYTETASRENLGHEVLRNMTIFNALGIRPERFNSRLRLGLSAESRAAALAITEGLCGKLVAMAPGSVWATKRWTVEGFAEVARRLTESSCRVLLIGGKGDVSAGQEIEKLAGVPITNLIGLVSLSTSAAVIERCGVLVSNDSAPLHMASAVGTPSVAVFCATVPQFGYGPWQVPHRIVQVDGISCRPCGRHGGQTCPTGTDACRLQIAPEQVTAAVFELLQPAEDAAA